MPDPALGRKRRGFSSPTGSLFRKDPVFVSLKTVFTAANPPPFHFRRIGDFDKVLKNDKINLMKPTPETPMMKQYLDAKRAAKDAILLFRMGDFYELFFDDAYKAAEALGLTVTTRDRNKGPDATPMAGFPHHQLDVYLARLIAAGYKVAVCEQLEDPKKTKTIVKREVIRIVTPGTVLDDAILDPKANNFLAAVAVPAHPRTALGPNDLALTAGSAGNGMAVGVAEKGKKGDNGKTGGVSGVGGAGVGGVGGAGGNGGNGGTGEAEGNGSKDVNGGTEYRKERETTIDGAESDEEPPNFPESARLVQIHPDETVGLAWVELSTGEFNATTLRFGEFYDQLARIHPAELLVPDGAAPFFDRHFESGVMVTRRPDWTFHLKTAEETLLRQFKVGTLEGFALTKEADTPAICAAGGILDYLRETQKQSLDHIESIGKYQTGRQLEIDEASQRSLEILRNSRDGRRDGTLLSVLDCCATPMGSRLLAEWVTYPLTEIEKIVYRQDAIEELVAETAGRQETRLCFRSVYDLARIISRVIQRRVTPRELVGVRKTLEALPVFKNFLDGCRSSLLKTLGAHVYLLEDLADELARAFGEDPPLQFRDGGFICPGYDEKLDEYRNLQYGGKQWLAEYQAAEAKRTGIPTLKVGFNSVFGYYIEVTRVNAEKVPASYVRKQTLKNAERYITEELKVYEEKVLNAEENAKTLEFEIFDRLTDRVAEKRPELQRTAGALAHLDVLAALAETAALRDYRRPQIVEEPVLHILDGRHPVLEAKEPTGAFVPNDADCSPDGAMIHLITGPNMAGKSTYIRQVALLVLMAQIGSFIPASEATIGVADRIFARVGASDELTRGLSTFMVEMIETARILHGAGPRSLVILDEIGRGTSTYDGISLAWAIAEALNHRIGRLTPSPGTADPETGGTSPVPSRGCRTFFATNYHVLTNLPDTCAGIDYLNVAVREWNDEIAFLHKIVPGPADRSYGIHVARLAGVPK